MLLGCYGCGGVTLTEGRGPSYVSVDLPMQSVNAEEVERSVDSNPLDKVWLEADKTIYEGIQIQRDCPYDDFFKRSENGRCALSISRSGKVLREFDLEYGIRHWLRYGVFDFLGRGKKQLIVHTYSGGAHCCYDYYIFELGPKFQELYSSDHYDSANEIGNALFPIDIDGDGIHEFYQDVMAFDYMGPAGHASASFPPAIFAFNKDKEKFELANRRFPDFVLEKLKELTGGIPEWAKVNEKYGAKIDDETVEEIIARNTFLYWVYAGKRDQAWEYFEKNYRTKSGDKYQDKFRDQFRKEFKEKFETDPTYLSIYIGSKTR